MRAFPLYKGATRAAVVLGVPLLPLVLTAVGVAVLALSAGPAWWGLLLPAWLLLAQVTRADDRAFRILGLWARTRLANRLRLLLRAGRGEFWGASSYALSDGRRRAWEAEDLRWGG